MTHKRRKHTKKNIKIAGYHSQLFVQKSWNRRNGSYAVPVAILIAGGLIAVAVIYSPGNSSSSRTAAVGNTAPQQTSLPSFGSGSSDNVKPVSFKDHIKGNLNAQVKIVEFSDVECPFCKRFHPTMKRVMDEYGKNGQVAWVYRHFPLDAIHSKTRIEVSAIELASELGGNDTFWAYLDRLFELTPSNNQFDLSLLPQIAEDVGLPRKPFEDLIAKNDVRGGSYADHIELDYQDAVASGGRGTPYSVVIAPNGKTFAISGAQPYSSVRAIIELALREK